MTEDTMPLEEERILEFLFNHANEHGYGPIKATDLEIALPDLSAEIIYTTLEMMESEDMFDDKNQGRAVFNKNRVWVTLSTGAWLEYGSDFLEVDVEEEFDSITDYLVAKGTASYPEIAENFKIPQGRVGMAIKILDQQNLVLLMHGDAPTAKWIGDR